MPKSPPQNTDVRESYIAAAHAVIAEKGIEHLSLREVARELGVSHQAPYRHFANRNDLLAEVIRRCFVGFALHLEARQKHRDPHRDLSALSHAYLDYARTHPLEYHLMFSTPKPTGIDRPDLLSDARRAFDILREALNRVHGVGEGQSTESDLDAMFVWATMHGLATITQNNPVEKLMSHKSNAARLTQHVMKRVESGLASSPTGAAAGPDSVLNRKTRPRRGGK
jgi:AcrR family transcriptional regulator